MIFSTWLNVSKDSFSMKLFFQENEYEYWFNRAVETDTQKWDSTGGTMNGESIYTWSDHVSLVLFETLKGVDSSLQSTSHHAQFDWAVSWI